MAKKKADPNPPPPAHQPRDAAEAPDSRAIIATMKGTIEFRDWLNELADFERTTSVQVLEKAAVFYARHVGFTKPAPKRTGGR